MYHIVGLWTVVRGGRFNEGANKKNGSVGFLDEMRPRLDGEDKNTDDKFGDCPFFSQLRPIFALILGKFAVIQKKLL